MLDPRSAIIYEVFAQLDALGVDGVDRLLGSFAGIEDEANRVADAAFEAYGELPGEGDMGDFADTALDEGIQYYQTLAELKQGVTNLLAVGLYHQFEQQRDYIKSIMHAGGAKFPDLREFGNWTKVDELRLLCNAVKHADGSSADELRKIRPDYFQSPLERAELLHRPRTSKHRPLVNPIGGKDLFVTRDDLSVYRDALRLFWEELLQHV
jgi:hypothetical protein